jgi:hypothetical protein
MSERTAAKLVTLVIVALLAVPFALRWPLAETRGYNPDELEHLHWSWCVSKGLLPNRDYFDHHTPWLHVLTSWFLPLYDVERVPDEAFAFITMARRSMMLFAGATLLLTWALGRALRDARTGLVAALLLSYTAFFLAKSVEFRPDVPAGALLLLSLYLALVGARAGSGAALFGSGLAVGAATMFTQKVLFVGPGFALALLWLLFEPRLSMPGRKRFRLAGAQAAGFALPLAVTLSYYAFHGALYDFIYGNFIVNTRWPGLRAREFLIELVERDPGYVILGLAGLAALLPSAFRPAGVGRMEPLIALPAVSLVATLPVHPGMSYQHFLLILPLFSLYAAAALLFLAETGARGAKRVEWALLLAAVLLLGIAPLGRFRDAFDRGNWGTLQAIQYVLRNSSPRETTFDGFTGLGLFRPQPFFHHFQYPHAFLLQTEEEHRTMLEDLESGRAIPKMIFWSHYLREAVTPEIGAFLERHYVPSGIEPIRIRPFDNGVGWWSDEAPRHLGWGPDDDPARPHVYFDDGWRPPSSELGADVRRTRTRRSGLIVPIRYPRDFEVVLRAHADVDAPPFALELVVNGASAGVADAVPRWQDYTFFVPVEVLRPGFNQFELRFSTADDAEHRRLELAVQTLQLREKR